MVFGTALLHKRSSLLFAPKHLAERSPRNRPCLVLRRPFSCYLHGHHLGRPGLQKADPHAKTFEQGTFVLPLAPGFDCSVENRSTNIMRMFHARGKFGQTSECNLNGTPIRNPQITTDIRTRYLCNILKPEKRQGTRQR